MLATKSSPSLALIERTGSIVAVYLAIAVATVLIAALFALGPLGHSDRYLTPQGVPADQIVA